MNEYLILESETFRKKLCTDQNTRILNEVGKLEHFTKNGWTTTEYIAKFYSVPVPTIKSIVLRNKNELIMDGYKILQKKDLKTSLLKLQKTFGIDIDKKLKPVHSKMRSIALFSRRAVLRIGMLLRDSEVAKSIRSYLLNTEHQTKNHKDDRQILGQVAYQLTQQATQLAQNAEQLICQANLVTAAVNEIQRTKEIVRKIDKRVELQEQRLKVLEKSLKPKKKISQKKISPEQVLLLKIELKKKKKSAVSIWSKFNKKFGITRYINLPASSFEEALRWMKRYKA
ncbi:hypothetical protein [Candidatus Uabimicrobium sp. HlEnr_7]|uniref:hypothetical protein n=1 Tax=Candidatus Uabimicrobium helgolandensis TaxID=3095367 RepID=UPI003556F9FE